MKKKILECCVDSVESAVAAAKGGADRLEVCSGLVIGGLTPSMGLLTKMKEETGLRMHALIRPRFGDFCYTKWEAEVICRDICMAKEAGADGVVVGALLPSGDLDQKQMEMFVKAAGNLSVTLHRAFDVCRDPFRVMEQAKNLGVSIILTSGQEASCAQGAQLLKELEEQSGEGLEIMAGAGVGHQVIKELHKQTGIRCFHMSGKVTKDSRMIYRKAGVPMGLPSLSEFEIWQTEEENIRKARKVLDSL